MKSLVLTLGLVLTLQGVAQTPAAPTQAKLSFWQKLQALVQAADDYIYGDIDSYGLSMRALGKRSRFSWYGLRGKLRGEVKHSPCKSVDCPNYFEDLAALTNARATKAKELEWLIDMPTAFKRRLELIEKAQSSIYVLTWGIYDDLTGTAFAEGLLKKLKTHPDIDIRVIVDEKVALLEVHRAVIHRLATESEGKIKLIKWKSERYRIHANHRKLMIIDDEHVILGGTNYGDVYSHLTGDQLWRDADVYLRGFGVASKAQAQFAEVWNEQIFENPEAFDFSKLDPTDAPDDGEIPVLLLDHNPGNKLRRADHNILSAIYKLIANARHSVDIENAYFILDPVMRDALKKASKRGVRIRLLTNSKESIDVPLLGTFVASSAKKSIGYGVEVYLKQGSTLHSKYLIIDGEIVMIGSHNMHPRSQTVDGENVAIIFDKEHAQTLQKHFEAGLHEAFHPLKQKDIKVDKSIIDFVYGTILFDHL